jgi:hypothetical protein
MRTLLNGQEVTELDTSIELKLKTKCPEKWLLIDQETGEVYTPYTTPGTKQWQKIGITQWNKNDIKF